MDPSQISQKTLLGKVVRLPFKLLPQDAIVRILRGPARGKRWIASSSAHGFWLGYWELENQRRFAHHLKPADVVYDIGAHVGLYALISSDKVGPAGRVYAFEPFPKNVAYLRQHIELNHLSNCTVIQAAVSESSGFRLFDPGDHSAAGHFSETGGVSVRTLSLDEFVLSSHNERPPSMIKINAEGAEMEVLKGARRTIAKFAPLIFASTHSAGLHRECHEFLLSAGYAVRDLSADKIWATPCSQANLQSNDLDAC
jgi:FkbM family methyltransferase